MFNFFKSALPEDKTEDVVDSIISQSGLDSLPADDLKFLKDNLTLQLSRRLGIVIMENLPEDGREEYSKLITDSPVPDSNRVDLLIKKFIPDFEAKIKEGLEAFVKDAVESLTKK